MASAMALSGCGSSASPSADAGASASPSPTNTDYVAQAACDLYRSMTLDAHNGVLTPDLVTADLRKIYDQAKYSPDKTISLESSIMLSSDLQNDTTNFKLANDIFEKACTFIGH